MSDDVVVDCEDCAFREAFDALGRARLALADHEGATGHSVDWHIGGVDGGVEQAGADAGVCGIPGAENPDTPLLDWQRADKEE